MNWYRCNVLDASLLGPGFDGSGPVWAKKRPGDMVLITDNRGHSVTITKDQAKRAMLIRRRCDDEEHMVIEDRFVRESSR